MPLDTRVGAEYDTKRVLKSKYDTERARKTENNKVDTIPLDARIESDHDKETTHSKNDNLEFSSYHSRAMTRESRKKEVMPTGYSGGARI